MGATSTGASASATPIGNTIVSRNPASGEPLGEVPVMGPEEVRAAVARARAAQVEWGALPVDDRARRVLAFRDEMVSRAEEIVDLLVKESGKTRSEALWWEVLVIADLATYFCKRAARILE